MVKGDKGHFKNFDLTYSENHFIYDNFGNKMFTQDNQIYRPSKTILLCNSGVQLIVFIFFL